MLNNRLKKKFIDAFAINSANTIDIPAKLTEKSNV